MFWKISLYMVVYKVGKKSDYVKVSIPRRLYEEIEQIIEECPMWRSRTEFIADSIRTQILMWRKVKEEG